MQPLTAKILYILYCALTGLTLAGIFVVYTITSIIYVFLATAICFGAFALIGKYTKVDLSKWGVYLFFAYTAYDVKKALDKSFMVEQENKGIYCAFQLFLDFINLFLDLLRLFGNRRD